MTCSVDKGVSLALARRQVFIALFIVLALLLHVVESMMPSPLPWFRLGVANIMTLAALFLYDPRAAWTVSLARVGIGALLLGRIFSPGFWLAISGAIIATSVMILFKKIGGDRFSPIGISVAGSVGHAAGQFLALRVLVMQHAAVWNMLPLFLLFAVFSGVLTGWIASLLLSEIKKHDAFRQAVVA